MIMMTRKCNKGNGCLFGRTVGIFYMIYAKSQCLDFEMRKQGDY
jgi:hypothetical protein